MDPAVLTIFVIAILMVVAIATGVVRRRREPIQATGALRRIGDQLVAPGLLPGPAPREDR